MTIREAQFTDIPHLIWLAERYAEKSGHPSQFCPKSAEATFEGIIGRDDAVLYVNDDITAAIGCWVFPLYLNLNDIIAECAFIWSDAPGDGRKMLKMAEDWGKEQGARYFHIYALKNRDRVAVLYQRAGYNPLETTYMKEL